MSAPPRVVVLRRLADLPNTAVLQTSQCDTPEAAQAWAQLHGAAVVYVYWHVAGLWLDAWCEPGV